MRATAVRRILVEPLTVSEINAKKLKIVLPPRSVAGGSSQGAAVESTGELRAEIPTQTSLLRRRPTVQSSAEAIALGVAEYARALGHKNQVPKNMRIELGDRGKSLFHKVPKEMRKDLKRLLKEH